MMSNKSALVRLTNRLGFGQIHTMSDSLRREERLRFTAHELHHRNKNLLAVEDAFCQLKSYLEIRPVFHWRPDRVRNHVRLCFIAYWLCARLGNEWRAKGEKGEAASIGEQETAPGLLRIARTGAERSEQREDQQGGGGTHECSWLLGLGPQSAPTRLVTEDPRSGPGSPGSRSRVGGRNR